MNEACSQTFPKSQNIVISAAEASSRSRRITWEQRPGVTRSNCCFDLETNILALAIVGGGQGEKYVASLERQMVSDG